MRKNILLLLCSITFILPIVNCYATTSQQATTNITPKSLTITNAWARKSMPPSNNSAAYMEISNKTDADVVIIGASAPSVANNVELHKSFVDDKGVSRMTTIDKIVVPAKTDIVLAPGGLHIMLFDLKKTLNVGDKFNIEIKQNGKDPLIIETEVK